MSSTGKIQNRYLPVGATPKKSDSKPCENNVLIYFHNGTEQNKNDGKQCGNDQNKKYKN